MGIRKVIVTALLVLSLPVAAEFQTVSLAYEIALSDFRVPATPSSGVQFKECEECEYRILRVTPNTRSVVNSQRVELQDFRRLVFGVRDRAAATVIVLHHLESDTVESISINI